MRLLTRNYSESRLNSEDLIHRLLKRDTESKTNAAQCHRFVTIISFNVTKTFPTGQRFPEAPVLIPRQIPGAEYPVQEA